MLRPALFAAALCAVTLAAQAAVPYAAETEGRVRVVTGAGVVGLPATAGLAVESVVGSAERWVAAGTVADGGFALFAGDAAEARRLPAPPLGTARLHRQPLPLVGDDGGLAGLAWLEGDSARGLAVRFARWEGLRWAPAETVAAPGPGTQTALAAAALADGTHLLAWSAFDGEDDEVLWSRWDGAAWSRPARIAADNRVPDVTPALAAVDGGALAAWATYDGGAYRVVLSRFADGRWSAPRPVAPPGTAFPGFEPAPVAPRLLVRQAAPAGWLLVELDARHRPVRQALAAGTGNVRPSMVDDFGDGVFFLWAGSDLAAMGSWETVERRATPEGRR